MLIRAKRVSVLKEQEDWSHYSNCIVNIDPIQVLISSPSQVLPIFQFFITAMVGLGAKVIIKEGTVALRLERENNDNSVRLQMDFDSRETALQVVDCLVQVIPGSSVKDLAAGAASTTTSITCSPSQIESSQQQQLLAMKIPATTIQPAAVSMMNQSLSLSSSSQGSTNNLFQSFVHSKLLREKFLSGFEPISGKSKCSCLCCEFTQTLVQSTSFNHMKQ